MRDPNHLSRKPLKFTKKELKALVESETILSEKNEYGGITIQYSFLPTHRLYKEGNVRAIVYLDNNEKPMKTVYYHNKYFSKGELEKSIDYYNHEGKKIIMESFLTKSASREKGYHKHLIYLNSNSEVEKSEVFLIEEFAEQKGFDRVIVYYNVTGANIRVEYFNKGKPIRSN